MNTTDDSTLAMRVALTGNTKAFDELVRRYQSQVRRFFLHQTLGDSQRSDDLAQDTFVKAYTAIAQFRGRSAFSTWLYRIAFNVLYDDARRRRPTAGIDDEGVQHRATASGGAQTALRYDLCKALALLKPAERTCITLQLIDGLPVGEIAEITQMPEGTVKSHLSRGKEKLTKYLRQNGY